MGKSPSSSTFRVGGGPYTVPLLIADASRISTVTLTLIFDPTKLRVVSVQEGSFLRGNGVGVVFTQAVNGNRIDISLSRAADAIGASGTGVLAAILFNAVAPGPAVMTNRISWLLVSGFSKGWSNLTTNVGPRDRHAGRRNSA
jgi:hypothetical protein